MPGERWQAGTRVSARCSRRCLKGDDRELRSRPVRWHWRWAADPRGRGRPCSAAEHGRLPAGGTAGHVRVGSARPCDALGEAVSGLTDGIPVPLPTLRILDAPRSTTRTASSTAGRANLGGHRTDAGRHRCARSRPGGGVERGRSLLPKVLGDVCLPVAAPPSARAVRDRHHEAPDNPQDPEDGPAIGCRVPAARAQHERHGEDDGNAADEPPAAAGDPDAYDGHGRTGARAVPRPSTPRRPGWTCCGRAPDAGASGCSAGPGGSAQAAPGRPTRWAPRSRTALLIAAILAVRLLYSRRTGEPESMPLRTAPGGGGTAAGLSAPHRANTSGRRSRGRRRRRARSRRWWPGTSRTAARRTPWRPARVGDVPAERGALAASCPRTPRSRGSILAAIVRSGPGGDQVDPDAVLGRGRGPGSGCTTPGPPWPRPSSRRPARPCWRRSRGRRPRRRSFISGRQATASDLSEYAETCSAVATSSHGGVEEVAAEGALRGEADGVHDAVEAVDVLADPVGQRVEVLGVR